MQQLLYSLPLLACPLGMGLMMWLMMRSGRKNTSPAAGTQNEEIAALRAELDQLHAEARARSDAPAGERR